MFLLVLSLNADVVIHMFKLIEIEYNILFKGYQWHINMIMTKY